MFIDPKLKSLVIFNAGGGIVEREIKLSLNQGENEFQIQNIPASFDPNSADIKLEYVNPEDKEFITLQQTIVSLPDKNNVEQVINREKSAANSIISYSIDFTREMREKVSNICEASSYRTYADMTGVFNFIINAKKESEVIVKIIYFINDTRIKWNVNLQVNIENNGKNAEIEGFIIVDNQTGFSYDNVELGFAIFELPSTTPPPIKIHPPSMTEFNQFQGLRDEMNQELKRLKTIKKTQRFKQIK
ncbi:MAG: hypothetical protein ACTSQJ_14350 [Promethearchaeota archaeon]